MNNDLQIRNSTAEFLIFATQNESDTIEVRFEENTLWLTQLTMAELFTMHSREYSCPSPQYLSGRGIDARGNC